jgi:hypothetical protein
VTGRGHLRLVTADEALEADRPRGLVHRAWLAWQVVSSVLWSVAGALMLRLATPRARQAAWRAGFDLALGRRAPSRGPRGWLRGTLEEHAAGNDVGWWLREARGDLGAPRLSGEQLLARRLAPVLGLPVPRYGARGVGGPFRLPPVVPLAVPDDGDPGAAVAFAAGRHAAPRMTRRVREATVRARGRHARPAWPWLAARRLRRVLPGAAAAAA